MSKVFNLMNKTILLILMIGILVSCSSDSSLTFEAGKYSQVSHSQLLQLINNNAVHLIDANSAKIYRTGHIPGAVNFSNYNDFISKLPQNKNDLIVCYCGNEQCTDWFEAAEKLSSLGHTNIQHYSLGINGWLRSGGIVQQGDS